MAAGSAFLTVGLGVVAGAQAPKGDLWETTSQMAMAGMPMAMPARTVKVCSAKDWKEPPGGQKNCKNTNMKIVGSKVTWDVACTGPTMNGHGEITRDGDGAYAGTIAFTSDQGNMTIKLTGKKIGDCDNPQ
jgi:hypothetical protein